MYNQNFLNKTPVSKLRYHRQNVRTKIIGLTSTNCEWAMPKPFFEQKLKKCYKK